MQTDDRGAAGHGAADAPPEAGGAATAGGAAAPAGVLVPPAPPAPPASPDEFLREARALAEHVARQGDLVSGADGKTKFDTLVDALAAAEADRAKLADVTKAYRDLSEITYKAAQVNGRTVLHTEEVHLEGALLKSKLKGPARRAARWALYLFAAAMAIEFLAAQSEYANSAVLVLLLAAVWGGIGSCLFVMKKISDSLFICAFDKGKAMGDASRIVLGAIIGLVVVALFVIPDAAAGGGADVTVGKVKFGPASIAFLSGLGVKAVYGAFENLVELLSGWLSGKR